MACKNGIWGTKDRGSALSWYHKTHMLPHLCVTDRAGVQPKLKPKPALTDFGLQPYVALVCHFNGLIRAI